MLYFCSLICFDECINSVAEQSSGNGQAKTHQNLFFDMEIELFAKKAHKWRGESKKLGTKIKKKHEIISIHR